MHILAMEISIKQWYELAQYEYISFACFKFTNTTGLQEQSYEI